MKVLPRNWIFSVHAEERCAKRFGLILDLGVRTMVSNQIESGNALRISEKSRRGSSIYEIDLAGQRVIAICNPEQKTIITVIGAKEWYRSVETKRRRRLHKNTDNDGEEE